MSKVISVALVVYFAAVFELPVGGLAVYAGILAFGIACLLTMVSAAHAAEKLFAWAVGLVVFGGAWPALSGMARRTALPVLGGFALFAVLYFVGAHVLKRLGGHEGKKHELPPPRPRLRADPPARHEPVVLPVPEEKPFDLFARRGP